MKRNWGFSWIELLIAITVLGVLTVITLPKFLDLAEDTRINEIKTEAANLTAANGVNIKIRKSDKTKGVAITNCTDVAKTLKENPLSNQYTIMPAPIAVNTSTNCILKGPKNVQATFTGTGIN